MNLENIIYKDMKYLKLFEDFENYSTFGHWIESLISDDYILELVNLYLKSQNQSLDLPNALNNLDEDERNDLKSKIDYYLENGIKDKDIDTTASVQITENYGCARLYGNRRKNRKTEKIIKELND
jgi:hypothetical protein